MLFLLRGLVTQSLEAGRECRENTRIVEKENL
jgi:hypothetical protein